LVKDKVLHAGDSVAIVIAESRELSVDAAELVDIDYEELPCVTDPHKAIQDGAPLVHDIAPNNKYFVRELGNRQKTDDYIAKLHHVTTLEFVNQRMIPNAIEPRAAIGDYDIAHDKHTLYTTWKN